MWQSLQLPTSVRYSPACSIVCACTTGPVAAGIALVDAAAPDEPAMPPPDWQASVVVMTIRESARREDEALCMADEWVSAVVFGGRL